MIHKGFTHARNKSADPFKSTFNPTTNRLQRNQAEKNRRERYNGFIKQLSSELPIAQSSGRRMDKMSILRLTAAYLRVNQKIVKEPFMLLNWKSDAVEDPSVNSFLSEIVDSLDGFFFFTDFTGNILFAAPTCAKYLGHHYTEILGVNVQKYLHPTDVPIFEEYLRGATEQILNGESTPAIFSTRCRMRIRNQPRSETVHYQTVNFHGSVTVGDDPQKVREDGKKTGESEDQKQKKEIKKSVLFFGLVQVIHPNPWDLSLTEATDNEYRSRLTLDGVMLEADHRISLIIGFTPMEVFGKSAYDFIHQDDLQISLFAHKQMLKNSNGTGIIVHRLVTASGGFVYLQSAGKMEYDAVTNKVFHFVCCSKLLVDEEGKEERNRFVSKFTPHIRKTTPIGLFESLTVDISQDFTDVIYKHSSRHLHSPAETPVTVTEVTYTRDYPEVPSATMQSLDMMMETIQTPDSGYAERIDEPNQANQSFSAESLSPQLQGAFPFLKQLKDYCANENGSKLPPRNTWTKFSYSIRAMTNYNGNGMPMTGAVFFEYTDKRRDGNTQAQKRNPGSNSENPEPPPVNMAFWEGLETKVMGRFRNCTEVTPTTSKNEAKRKKYMENVPNTGMCNTSDFASSSPTAASTHTITSRDLPLDVNGSNGTLSAYSSNESLLKYDTAQQVINNENSYKNTNSYHQANSNNNNGFSSGTMYIDYSTFALPEESLSTAASGALLTDPNNGLTLSLPLFHADAGGSVVEKPFFTSTSTSPLQQSGTQMSMSGFEDFVAFPELCLDMGRTES